MRDPRPLPRPDPAPDAAAPGAFRAPRETEAVRFSDVAAFFRRHRVALVAPPVAFLLLAALHVLTATPLYTASARLLVDAQGARALEGGGAQEVQVDAATIESHVESVRSVQILSRALDALGGPGEAGGRGALAVRDLEESLTIRRVGQSRLVEVSAVAEGPERAARVANAVAEAYVREQVEARSAEAGRAALWLERRAEELRARLAEVNGEIEAFKARSGIVETASGPLEEQRVSDLGAQLAQAEAQAAEARARLGRVEAVLRADPRDATVAEAFSSEAVARLRREYQDAAAREAEFVARYGADHPAARRQGEALRELGAALAAEMERIAAKVRSDHEIAQAREEAARAALAQAVERAAAARQARARLRELEGEAEIHRNGFQDALRRHAAALQQRTFPIAEARIASAAVPPPVRSHPRPALELAFALVLGCVVGVGAATVRNHLDRGVRRPGRIRDALGVPCLASVPRTGGGRARERHADVVADPLSGFADALREVKTSLDVARSVGRVHAVGVVSARAGEGRSTVAANLAALFAQGGTPTLLVDADMRAAGLSAALGAKGRPGLAEVLAGRLPAEAAELEGGGPGGARFLPAAAEAPIPGSSDLLGSEAMRDYAAGARGRSGLVLVDLPPILAVPDARAAGPALDAAVLVAEWGRTPMDALARCVEALEGAQVQVLGVVLNKVDPHEIERERSGAAGRG
jgi:succinoglycan biosynthesis transport protein ExoP